MNKSDIQIKLDKDYESFKTFYDENIVTIYKSTIKLFELFKNNRKKVIKLSVDAKIDGLSWGTEMIYRRDDVIILKRDLLPYFEFIEDYDTCIEIRDLYSQLSKTN